MKKATIIITALSILVSIATYLVIKKTDEIVKEISLAEEIANSMDASSKSFESSIDDAGDDYKYYYEDLQLNEKQYVEVNECMQFYLTNESFANALNCQEKIVDAIIEEDGELSFIKSVIGDMLVYSKTGASLDVTYLRNLILADERKTFLKEKLILAFVNRYRDPVKLEKTFIDYKSYFYDYIPQTVYDMVYKEYVNTFINTYNEIHENKDVEAFYKDIYFKADKLNKQDEYWFYTFWKRRELEKNDQIIYGILNEINTHYTN